MLTILGLLVGYLSANACSGYAYTANYTQFRADFAANCPAGSSMTVTDVTNGRTYRLRMAME